MASPSAAQRLQRPLAAVAVVLVLIGVIAVVVRRDAGDVDASADRATTNIGGQSDGGSDDADTSDTSVPGDTVPDAALSDPASPEPTGVDGAGDGLAERMAVPAAGTYRYEVEQIRDGESQTFAETRTIETVDVDGDRTRVRLSISTDGQEQVSVLQWAPSAVTVRSTRLPSGSGPGSECTWDPPIIEFGVLTDGNAWDVSSSCTAEVAGTPTTFTVDGSGRVVGDVVIRVGEREVRVWRIERLRTTVITAEINGEPVEQRVDERGDLFVDPAQGIVVRSESVLTRSGPQTGTTRRVSSLVD